MTDHIHQHAHGATSFVGPKAVELYRATVIESAIRMYLKTGMKANRLYTPTNMLAAASQITGQTFKRGQLAQAADAILAWRTDPANIPPVIDDRKDAANG